MSIYAFLFCVKIPLQNSIVRVRPFSELRFSCGLLDADTDTSPHRCPSFAFTSPWTGRGRRNYERRTGGVRCPCASEIASAWGEKMAVRTGMPGVDSGPSASQDDARIVARGHHRSRAGQRCGVRSTAAAVRFGLYAKADQRAEARPEQKASARPE